MKAWTGLLCTTLLVALGANAQQDSKNDQPHPDKKSSPVVTLSGDRVYRVGGGVSAPKTTQRTDPIYTQAAREKQIEGAVVLWLIVNAQGMPEQIKVQRSLDAGLDANAIEAVRQWTFYPALKDGNPVAVMINVEVNYKLH
jgi:protein TonB